MTPGDRLTPIEVALIEAARQLPPFRRMDRWWRRRSWRVKALWYGTWAVGMAVAILLRSRASTGRGQTAG